MTEDQLAQETLGWLANIGDTVRSGPDIAHDGSNPQRTVYTQVILPGHLRDALPHAPCHDQQITMRRGNRYSISSYCLNPKTVTIHAV